MPATAPVRSTYRAALVSTFVSLAALGCGDDAGAPSATLGQVNLAKLHDVGNSGGSADILTQFDSSTLVGSAIEEVRLIFVKAPTDLSEADALALSADRYYAAGAPAANAPLTRLPASLNDSDGAPVANDVPYRVYVLALSGGGVGRLSAPRDLTLKDRPVYAGKYVGLWTDGLGSFDFSIRISDDYTGKMYYTNNFRGCCGPTQDATFVMQVEGSTITSFAIDQYLVAYPSAGDHCPTKASSEGSFTDEITLVLAPFRFSDCDGDRTVNAFRLVRQD